MSNPKRAWDVCEDCEHRRDEHEAVEDDSGQVACYGGGCTCACDVFVNSKDRPATETTHAN